MVLPFSQACENNKQPILSVLKVAFAECRSVLEVGSGTGQHAVYFAEHLPHLHWQPSDQGDYLAAVAARVDAEPQANLRLPALFDVYRQPPSGSYDALFTANTCHIMPESGVEALFDHLTESLATVKTLCIYGPFKVAGEHTSESNVQFDESLKRRDPRMGIRDQEWIVQLAHQSGFNAHRVHRLPANNQLLEFHR